MMQGIPQTFNDKPRRYVWEYRTIEGEPLGYVARFDDGKKKDVVPYFKHTDGRDWKSGSITENRPLYGLDALQQAENNRAVFIVEGEKAAAALQSLGLVAITSQGGSQAADKSDWQPLNGRKRVYLLPDNDEPGSGYIKAVAAILVSLKQPPAVSIVHLPNLPPAGDVVDWITAHIDNAFLDWDGYQPVKTSGINTKVLLADFQKIVKDNSQPVPADWKAVIQQANTPDWQSPISLESTKLPPWPGDVFPESMQNFVTALSQSTETPPELSAMMVLAALSACAQGKYRVRVKPDYFEPVNIWTCAALPPGSRKTAVQMAATAPLTKWEKLQREAIEPEIKKAQADGVIVESGV